LLSGSPNLPRGRRYKPLLALACVLATLAGCGGGGDEDAQRTVAGPGFTFSAPASWGVETGGRSGSASPHPGGIQLVSVRVFRLARPYSPELWETVVPELDRVAGELADQLGGRIASSSLVVVDGRRAKRYDIRYDRDGTEILERTAFVLEGRREFQLVCRHEAADDGDGPRACATLFSTLRLE
jgi:hypothetical protein